MAVIIRGIARTQQNLKLVAKAVQNGLKAELADYSEEVLALSRDYAPQLTGAMIADSGISRVDRQTGASFSVFYRKRYALFQHEGFYNPGPVTAAKPNAGRKFLERAYLATRRQRLDRIARRIEREIRLALR